jgi:hypothetical protein
MISIKMICSSMGSFYLQYILALGHQRVVHLTFLALCMIISPASALPSNLGKIFLQFVPEGLC